MTDVYPLADGGRAVSYLTRSADSCSLHLLDVNVGADDVITRFPCLRFTYLRGWTRGDGAAVIVRPVKLNDDTTNSIEIILITPKGEVSRVYRLDQVYVSSTRLDSERLLLYMTRTEEGVHNMYALSLETGKLLSVTRNKTPDVTFTGVEPIGGGLVVGARHERKSDIWLLEPRPGTAYASSRTVPR
jgi:hypothetical protein